MSPPVAALPPILFITGTDTGVGKTITTAALAAVLSAPPGGARDTSGRRTLAVYKPAQTGVSANEPGDMEEVRRLAGTATVYEGIRLRAAMAPAPAAIRQAARLPALAEHATRIRRLAQGFDQVLVEGAGGLLVGLDGAGGTLADLAAGVAQGAAVVVVCRSGLGTQNHTLLTLEALGRRNLPVAGVVIGAWPASPDAVERDNEQYLRRLPVPLLGIIPENAAALEPAQFRARAPGWFGLP